MINDSYGVSDLEPNL